MGFPNQFSTDQFFNQRIKALKVVCEVPNVNEFGVLTGVALPTTLAIVGGVVVEVATGLPVTIVITQTPGTPILPGPIGIIPGTNGKITNSLTVTVTITAVTAAGLIITIATGTPILVSAITETHCELQPNDIVQKHDVQFRGATFVVADTTLTVTAVVELCLVIARESIFKINAAELFCR